MKNNNATALYTAYLVTDPTGDRFLNRRVYSGRIRGVWSPIEQSFIFRSASRAQSCASNINRRSASGREYARVVPVLLERRRPTRA